MIRLALCLSPLLLSGCSSSSEFQISNGYFFDFGGEAAERTESGVVAPSVHTLSIDHVFGEVDVAAAGPGENTGWAWTVQTWSDDRLLAQEFAERIELLVTERNGTLELVLEIPESPGRWLRGVKSHLTVRVAADSNLRLGNQHSVSRVGGLTGKVELETAHGDCFLDHLPNGYEGRHGHGDLHAQQIGSSSIHMAHGDIELTEVGGELTVRCRHGALIAADVLGASDLEIEHGDVRLERLHETRARGAHGDWTLSLVAGDLELEGQHGNVQIEMESGYARASVQHGDLQVDATRIHGLLQTRFGDLDLGLSDPTGLAISASAEFGEVEGDLTERRHDTAAPHRLELTAEHGDIRLDRR